MKIEHKNIEYLIREAHNSCQFFSAWSTFEDLELSCKGKFKECIEGLRMLNTITNALKLCGKRFNSNMHYKNEEKPIGKFTILEAKDILSDHLWELNEYHDRAVTPFYDSKQRAKKLGIT